MSAPTSQPAKHIGIAVRLMSIVILYFLYNILLSCGGSSRGLWEDYYYTATWDFSDSSAYRYDPTEIEVADGMARLRPKPDAMGEALLVNAPSEQYALIEDADQSGLDLGRDDFLFTAWMRLDPGGTTFNGILEKRGRTGIDTVGLQFHLEESFETYRFRTTLRTAEEGGKEYIAYNAIDDNDWHHIGLAVSRRQGTLQYFLDGAPFGTVFDISDMQGSLANPGPFMIGRNSLGYFNGALDEACYWKFDDGMPDDVLDIVRSHFGLNITDRKDLVSCWGFNGRSGTDRRGSNDLTLLNSPSFFRPNVTFVSVRDPSIQTECKTDPERRVLYSLADLTTTPAEGGVHYQVSADGADWFFYDAQSGAWQSARYGDVAQASVSRDIREHLPEFPEQTGSLCLNIILSSNGLVPVELDEVRVIAPEGEPEFLDEPIVLNPTPSSFQVAFETSLPVEAFVRYGSLSDSTDAQFNDTPLMSGGTVLRIDVEDLIPDSMYEYQVFYRPRTSLDDFASIEPRTVVTPPAEGDPAMVTFVVWGDSRPAEAVPEQPPVFSTLIRSALDFSPAFYVANGDNVNLSHAVPFGQEEAFSFYHGWRDAYDAAGGWGYLFYVLGNHDAEGYDEPERSYAAFARLRSVSSPSEADSEGRYYSWRWGDALFAAIDGSGSSISAKQEAWLRGVLNQEARWKIVFTHYPMFNSGRTFSDDAQRDRLHVTFQLSGVDIVFQGHDHFFADGVVDGIHYTTSGGAGSPLHDYGGPANQIIEHHYLKVDMAPDRINVSAIGVSEDEPASKNVLYQYSVH